MLSPTAGAARLGVPALVILLAACAAPQVDRDRTQGPVTVLDPATDKVDDWEHHVLRRGATEYRMVDVSGGRLLRAQGRDSASLLLRVLQPPVSPACGRLTWSWRVARLQREADLTDKRRHDVGASLFVAFGDPGVFRDRRVPTLQYAWTNHSLAPGRILSGPYHEKHLRTIVLRRGASDSLVVESRNVVSDFQQVFGKAPPSGVHAVAVFTDNDDTGEPVRAYYGRIALTCEPQPGS